MNIPSKLLELVKTVFNLTKNTEANTSEIKSLKHQVRDLSNYIIKLKSQLELERQKNQNLSQKYELEFENLRLSLDNKLKDFHITLLKEDYHEQTNTNNKVLKAKKLNSM